MTGFGESSFADRSGLHNHPVDGKINMFNGPKRIAMKKRRRSINVATLCKASCLLITLKVLSSIKIKKKIRKFETELKRKTIRMESLKEIKRSKVKRMDELEKRIFMVKGNIAGLVPDRCLSQRCD